MGWGHKGLTTLSKSREGGKSAETIFLIVNNEEVPVAWVQANGHSSKEQRISLRLEGGEIKSEGK